MSPDPENNAAGDASRPEADESGTALPRRPARDGAIPGPVVLSKEVQEHIGQQLRTEYDIVAEKPAFLGDPAIPEQFDWQIARLETRERAQAQAVDAVEKALEELVLEVDEDESPEKRPKS